MVLVSSNRLGRTSLRHAAAEYPTVSVLNYGGATGAGLREMANSVRNAIIAGKDSVISGARSGLSLVRQAADWAGKNQDTIKNVLGTVADFAGNTGHGKTKGVINTIQSGIASDIGKKTIAALAGTGGALIAGNPLSPINQPGGMDMKIIAKSKADVKKNSASDKAARLKRIAKRKELFKV